MRLRTHIHLIVAALCAVCLLLAVAAELNTARRAVHEEIVAANAVAAQLLGDFVNHYAGSPEQLVPFLAQLGRVRAQEISVYARDGALLYRSPASTYKAGREAPRWFSKLLLPATPAREYPLRDGARMVVTANASRAVLDGFDDLLQLLAVGIFAFAILNGLVVWLVNRAVKPLPVIADGLAKLRRGDLSYRLPRMPGYETAIIAEAFNSMAQAVQDKVAAEVKARDAEARLEERRELSQLIEQRIEEERRMIARELHDEFAQSVTAIRSLAVAITQQSGSQTTTEAAALISSEAARLYDAMHGLIPRLTPFAFADGLAAALRAFIDEWQRRHPRVQFSIAVNVPDALGQRVTLAVYRVVQEGVINALRHGKPGSIAVSVARDDQRLIVQVLDDGIGLADDWRQPGRFGLRGLTERVEQLHGMLSIESRATGGVELAVNIPLAEAQ